MDIFKSKSNYKKKKKIKGTKYRQDFLFIYLLPFPSPDIYESLKNLKTKMIFSHKI